MCRDQIRRSHKLTHKEHLDIYFDEVFKTKYEHVIIYTFTEFSTLLHFGGSNVFYDSY